MKVKAFSFRNAKEILRDPLSYIFCVGFPLVMLVIMTVVNKSIPKEAAMDIFNLSKLVPAIAVFGFTFIMLFMAILLSKDRESMFLSRLCGAPMKPWEFMAGYTLPVLIIALLQVAVTYAAALLIAFIEGEKLSLLGMATSAATFIPVMLMFINFGIILGAAFGSKSAPGIASVLITVVSLLGGIWMDIEALGGSFFAAAKKLPFYWAVEIGREAMATDVAIQRLWGGGVIIAIYLIATFLIGMAVLKKNVQEM